MAVDGEQRGAGKDFEKTDRMRSNCAGEYVVIVRLRIFWKDNNDLRG